MDPEDDSPNSKSRTRTSEDGHVRMEEREEKKELAEHRLPSSSVSCPVSLPGDYILSKRHYRFLRHTSHFARSFSFRTKIASSASIVIAPPRSEGECLRHELLLENVSRARSMARVGGIIFSHTSAENAALKLRSYKVNCDGPSSLMGRSSPEIRKACKKYDWHEVTC